MLVYRQLCYMAIKRGLTAEDMWRLEKNDAIMLCQVCNGIVCGQQNVNIFRKKLGLRGIRCSVLVRRLHQFDYVACIAKDSCIKMCQSQQKKRDLWKRKTWWSREKWSSDVESSWRDKGLKLLVIYCAWENLPNKVKSMSMTLSLSLSQFTHAHHWFLLSLPFSLMCPPTNLHIICNC